ncbi:hypothetical protein QFC21_004450 [Naganishia friedmannii]|uniref:Uncharacterized protein n=1 Tax=Naganishia friedmannii TaxID=89922 RepID=A0ACC2VGA3_9TREE|nr:hypothetical protein QFC21_004450 [Naganishia friedmannii]
MLAAFLADEDARKRRRDGPVGILPSPQPEPPAPPADNPSATHTEDAQEAPSSRRPRRHTPYGPLPIRPGETVAEQIDAIQQQHHQVASHAYFLTDKALRGTAADVVDPVGIWGFERSMVQRFPSLKKRNFFCIQHHQATALHYDLRLQLRGGTYSWAVPKGFMGLHRTREPNHQAIQTPVHPISYTHHEVSHGMSKRLESPLILLFVRVPMGDVQLWDIGEYVIDAVQAREADSPEPSSVDDPTGSHEEEKLWHAINGKRYERDKAGVRHHKKPSIHITLKNGKKVDNTGRP